MVGDDGDDGGGGVVMGGVVWKGGEMWKGVRGRWKAVELEDADGRWIVLDGGGGLPGWEGRMWVECRRVEVGGRWSAGGWR